MVKMNDKCAWCKVNVNERQRFVADSITDRKCSKCGAWNDIGQKVIYINSMKQMYEGCLKLMQEIISICGEILETAEIDFDDIKETLDMDKDKPLSVDIGTYEIVRQLFLSHGSCGGTSIGNMKHLLKIDDESINFCIEDKEDKNG